MRQIILFSCSLLLAASAAGQTGRNKAYKINKVATREPAVFPTATTAKLTSNTHPHTLSVPYTRFSSAMNAFGFVTNEQNPLTYNPDINCLALFQRHTADWPNSQFIPPPGAGKSGYQVVKFTTNNGTSWDSVNYYQDDSYWGRYPSGVIYNPAGNATLGNAWFVGTGPATGAAPNDNWYANWFASVQIPTGGSRTITTNDQQFAKTNQAGSLCDNTYYSSYSTTIGGPAAARTVYSAGLKLYTTPVTTTLTGLYGVAIYKGSFNGSSGFNWVQDSTFIHLWTVSGGDEDLTGPKIAFSADGMTGYIIINGSDKNASLPAAKQFYQPMVWKTTDGGTNWNRVNTDYDWITNHPEILENIRPTRDGSTTVPAFFDTYGRGTTVDMNGKLHYVTAVVPGYSVHPDSLGFGFAYPFGYQRDACDDHPWIYDFVTDGSGTWDAIKIAGLYTAPLGRNTTADTNAAMNQWTNAGEYIDYDNKIRASRSADGTKIFYTWTDGDTSNLLPFYNGSTYLYDAYAPNVYPNLFYKGMDVASGLLSPTHINSATNTNSGGYWFYLAPDVVLTNGGGTSYTIPCTYLDSRPGTFDGMSPVDVYYADDNTIAGTEFTETAAAPCVIGVKKANSLLESVELFPNPTAGAATLKVNLEKAEQLTVTVKDQLGRIISTQTAMGVAGQNNLAVDISTASSGVYFCTVKTEKAAVTRKLSVIK